jgi:cell division protein FtsQ
VKVKKKLIPKRQKPSRSDREDARRFAANVSTGLLIVGAVVGLVMVANRWAKKEEMRSIRIIGRTILDSAEIMEHAAIPDSVPLQKLDLQAIEERIASHPFIARAAVYRGENGTLVVEIAERAPVAVTMVGGAPLYIDSLGVALPYRFSSAGFDLPIVSGIDNARAVSRIDSARTHESLGVLAALRNYDEGLYRQISEVRREPNGEYVFLTADDAVPVRAGFPADIPGRLAKLDLFLTSVLASRGADDAGSIDLRWKGQVVVRWKNAANYQL